MSRLLHHPAVAQFRASEALTEGLRTLLADPTMISAISRLRSAITPSQQPQMRPGVHIDTLLAHEFQRLLGAQEILTTLEGMTHFQLDAPPVTEEDEDFAHTLTPLKP